MNEAERDDKKTKELNQDKVFKILQPRIENYFTHEIIHQNLNNYFDRDENLKLNKNIIEEKINNSNSDNLNHVIKSSKKNGKENTIIENKDTLCYIDKDLHTVDKIPINNSKYLYSENSFLITQDMTKMDLYKGIIFMLLSCIFKTIYTILSKYSMYINDEVYAFEILTYRNYFMMIICIVIIPFMDMSTFTQNFVSPKSIKALIFRSISSIVSMAALIFCLKHLHGSNVYSVYYIYPEILMILSVIFLGEKINYLDIICLFACIVGAILVIKPEFLFKNNDKVFTDMTQEGKLGLYIIIFLSAILKAVEDLVVKNIGKEIHVLAISYFFHIFRNYHIPYSYALF